ncbi:GNAT family N-acetyltransferase [bacterium]|nr:GNAT family N-acetyltransferase [bacterium]
MIDINFKADFSIQFRATDKKNFHQIIKLRVSSEQIDYIDSNLYSIAYSKVCPSLATYGIYAQEVLVGFTQFGKDPNKSRYMLAEIMVDKKYQGNGIGKLALNRIIDLLKKEDQFDSLVLTCVPENQLAITMYIQFGFVLIDEIIIEDEITMQLDFLSEL